MKNHLFLIIFFPFCVNAMNATKNQLTLLPLEMQAHILQFLPFPVENDEEAKKNLMQQKLGNNNTSLVIHPNKKRKKMHIAKWGDLQEVDDSREKRSLVWVRKDTPIHSNCEQCAIFATSPNGEKTVFESLHPFGQFLDELALVDVSKNEVKKQTVLLTHFRKKVVEIKEKEAKPYIDKGYQYIQSSIDPYWGHRKDPRYYKLLFSHMAIANNGLIAVVDISNACQNNNETEAKIYLIDPIIHPEKEEIVQLHQFSTDLFTVTHMRFNMQSTKLFVAFTDKNNTASIHSFDISKKEIYKSLDYYLQYRGVCKAEKFQKNNI